MMLHLQSPCQRKSNLKLDKGKLSVSQVLFISVVIIMQNKEELVNHLSVVIFSHFLSLKQHAPLSVYN